MRCDLCDEVILVKKESERIWVNDSDVVIDGATLCYDCWDKIKEEEE